MAITDREGAGTTAITTRGILGHPGTEEDTIPQSQDQATSTTEHHEVGIRHKYGAIHSEHGNKTCKFGFT